MLSVNIFVKIKLEIRCTNNHELKHYFDDIYKLTVVESSRS